MWGNFAKKLNIIFFVTRFLYNGVKKAIIIFQQILHKILISKYIVQIKVSSLDISFGKDGSIDKYWGLAFIRIVKMA